MRCHHSASTALLGQFRAFASYSHHSSNIGTKDMVTIQKRKTEDRFEFWIPFLEAKQLQSYAHARGTSYKHCKLTASVVCTSDAFSKYDVITTSFCIERNNHHRTKETIEISSIQQTVQWHNPRWTKSYPVNHIATCSFCCYWLRS